MRFLLRAFGWLFWPLNWILMAAIVLVVAAVVLGAVGWVLVASWQSGTWVWVYPLIAVGLVWWWHSWDVGGSISGWLYRRRAS